MFRKSKIAWSLLFITSVKQVLKQHGISEEVLVVDETDHHRAKKIKRIYKTHQQKESITGGYVNGQTIVFLLLVTNAIIIPVGVSFLYA